jgi:hypothetical protein
MQPDDKDDDDGNNNDTSPLANVAYILVKKPSTPWIPPVCMERGMMYGPPILVHPDNITIVYKKDVQTGAEASSTTTTTGKGRPWYNDWDLPDSYHSGPAEELDQDKKT